MCSRHSEDTRRGVHVGHVAHLVSELLAGSAKLGHAGCDAHRLGIQMQLMHWKGPNQIGEVF